MSSRKRKCVELIAFDKNHKLEYQGYCKLIVDCPSGMLSVKPKNNEFKTKSASFKWKFFVEKNILFIFGENEMMNFALIFVAKKLCNEIYDLIIRNKDNIDTVTKEMLHQQFLIPIFNKNDDDENFKRIQKIMKDWIIKNKYLQLIKNIERNDTNLARKRKHDETKMKKISCVSQLSNEYSKIIPSSQFKIVTVKVKGGFRRKLIIFASAEDKTKCYEFTCKNQIYRCYECRKHQKYVTAKLEYDNEKKEVYIKLTNKLHICSPIPYNPQKYEEIIIVKKPGYEFLENCSIKSGRILFIFNPNDRNLCYEYLWRKLENKFYCRGCHLMKKNTTTAEICNENKENEYIQLLNNDHICEYRNYQPQKYAQFKDIVLKPDFEIQTKIKSGQKTLIIFDRNDRSLCYSYFFNNERKAFFCAHCHEKRKIISAKLCQNEEGEEYIILSNVQHVCSLRKYIPQMQEICIIRPPQIKLTIVDNRKILFIFTSADAQDQCYVFSSAGKNSNRYICGCCTNLVNTKNGKNELNEKAVYCYLSKEDGNNEDEYYVKMPPNQKHLCKPQKYEPEKYVNVTIQPSDYFLFRQKQKTRELLYLAIYHSKNRSLCYKYFYNSKSKQFVCNACGNHKNRRRITAKLQQNSEGNEFIVKNQVEHICKPLKVSTIKQMKDIKILENSGIIVHEKPTSKKRRINIDDESKILRLPNFELQRSVTGVKDGKLIVFKDGDKKLCYNYFFNKNENFYGCAKCIHLKVRVRADLHIDEKTGERCIVLGKNEHICEPANYEPEKKEIENTNFMVFNRESKTKPIKLVVFTSPSKELCYEFIWSKSKKYFSCHACEMMKIYVSAKILKNENGQEFVQQLKNDHVCQPKKFVFEKFQPKIIPKSGFFICTNSKGKPNSRLIVFDEKKEGFCYEYYLKKNNFVCVKCAVEYKKDISAKLVNDGECIELSSNPHLCQSTKFDSKKYQDKEILSD